MTSLVKKITNTIHKFKEMPSREEIYNFQLKFILNQKNEPYGSKIFNIFKVFQFRRFFSWLFLWVRQSICLALRKPLGDMSASLTYTFTLSVVPLLAIGFSFFKLFGGLKNLLNNTVEPLLENAFPEDVSLQLLNFLNALVSKLDTSTLTAVSFTTFLVTVVALLRNIERCFNEIYDEKSARSILRQFTNYWFFISFTPLIVAFSVLKSSEVSQNLVWLTQKLEEYGVSGVFPFARWLFSQFLQMSFFAVLFSVIPSKKISLQCVIASAIITNLGFECLQNVNWYLTKRSFSDPTANQIYGSIPLLAVVFFIWIRLIWVTILAGAILCAGWATLENELKTQGEHDTLFEDVVLSALLFEKINQHFNDFSCPIPEKILAKTFESRPEYINRCLIWMKKSGLLFSAQGAEDSGFSHKLNVVGPTPLGLKVNQNSKEFLKMLKAPQQDSLLCKSLAKKIENPSTFIAGLIKE
jgi:membrane protein